MDFICFCYKFWFHFHFLFIFNINLRFHYISYVCFGCENIFIFKFSMIIRDVGILSGLEFLMWGQFNLIYCGSNVCDTNRWKMSVFSVSWGTTLKIVMPFHVNIRIIFFNKASFTKVTWKWSFASMMSSHVES